MRRQVHTAVKYGNGEIETIERLVDIGHFEVQVTPDNCQASLISVDQIVQDGHTVTFSATETIIADDRDRYRLAYPRVINSREWVVPMNAMEDITQLRQSHPRNVQTNLQLQQPKERTRAQTPRVLLSHLRSGRLHEIARGKHRRVLRLHKRMIHAPEDIMCEAVQGDRPMWKTLTSHQRISTKCSASARA